MSTHPPPSDLHYIVFTDFDGTITVEDIGDKMFQTFGDGEKCNIHFQEYTQGKIDARECWRRSCETLEGVSYDEFTTFAAQQRTDEHFGPFLHYCSDHSIPVIVLSDGFDAYINTILDANGFSTLPRYSNELQFLDSGDIIPVFPHTDAECLQCANCKRNHVLTHAGERHVIVYIGDGYSDRCPVRFADVVFAKGSLVSYCEKENITYHRFSTFDEVLAKFRHMNETSRPKKRTMAEHARKEIFLQG